MKSTILSSLLIVLSCTMVQAQNWWKDRIKGEGPTVEKTMSVSSFDGVSLAISGDLHIRQGSTQEVVVKAQQNIIDNLEMEVEDGHLKIKSDRPVYRHSGIDVYITVPTLERLGVSGSGNVNTDGKFTGLSDMQVAISGSGNITFSCEASGEIAAKISGSGNINLDGSGESVDLRISGSGNIRAGDLKVKNGMVRISGSGNAYVNATENLEVSASGSGDVKYKGRPRLKAKTSGSGDVEAM